jgi:hypothetical protein
VQVELDPFVECDPWRQLLPRPLDAIPSRMAQGLRPPAPLRTVNLRDGVERREVAQGATLVFDPAGHAPGIRGRLEDRLEGLHLQGKDGVMVDVPALVQGASLLGQGSDAILDSFRALHLLDPQVQKIPKASGR